MIAVAQEGLPTRAQALQVRRGRPGTDFARGVRCLAQARSAHAGQESGDLRHRSRVAAGHGAVRPRFRHRPAGLLHRPDRGLAVVHGAVRQLRRGDRRRPRPRAGRRPASHAHRNQGQAPRRSEKAQRLQAGFRARSAAGRRCPRRGRRHHPGRRRRHRRHRFGQRSRGDRRIRARHPRIRRRPLRRHRRHHRDLRLDRGAHHVRCRLVVSRPHDCAGRGRRAAEDAERDRAQHPARRHDHRLPGRGGDAHGPRRLLGNRCIRARAGRAARHARFRPRSAGCCRRSASPAWTGCSSSTCLPCRAARSKPPATSTRCCSTRPAPSPSATVWRPRSSPCPASPSARRPRRRCSPALPTRRPRVARSWRWCRRNTA